MKDLKLAAWCLMSISICSSIRQSRRLGSKLQGKKKRKKTICSSTGRAGGSYPSRCRFDSYQIDQSSFKANNLKLASRPLAQWLEHPAFNRGVVGSSPTGPIYKLQVSSFKAKHLKPRTCCISGAVVYLVKMLGFQSGEEGSNPSSTIHILSLKKKTESGSRSFLQGAHAGSERF